MSIYKTDSNFYKRKVDFMNRSLKELYDLIDEHMSEELVSPNPWGWTAKDLAKAKLRDMENCKRALAEASDHVSKF